MIVLTYFFSDFSQLSDMQTPNDMQKLRIAQERLMNEKVPSEHCASFEINIIYEEKMTQNTQ